MFAGHVGAALAIGRIERQVNVGVFVPAALFLDFVLWILVILGWESVVIPANFANTHQAEFDFPYSHGLLASVAWSVLAAGVTYLRYPGLNGGRLRAASLVGAAVFSHWLLDVLVHVPELPIAGSGSLKVGLGLWESMPAALLIEALIAGAGLWLFVPGAGISRARKIWLTVLSLLLIAFTVLGMTVAPPPPSATAMAASSLATIAVVCAFVFWLAKPPRGQILN